MSVEKKIHRFAFTFSMIFFISFYIFFFSTFHFGSCLVIYKGYILWRGREHLLNTQTKLVFACWVFQMIFYLRHISFFHFLYLEKITRSVTPTRQTLPPSPCRFNVFHFIWFFRFNYIFVYYLFVCIVFFFIQPAEFHPRAIWTITVRGRSFIEYNQLTSRAGKRDLFFDLFLFCVCYFGWSYKINIGPEKR